MRLKNWIFLLNFNSFKLNLNGCMWLLVIELGRTGMRNRYYEVSQFSQCGCEDWARCKCSIVFSDNCPQGYQSFRIITCKHINLQWRWLSLYPEVQYILYVVKCPCTCTCSYSEKANKMVCLLQAKKCKRMVEWGFPVSGSTKVSIQSVSKVIDVNMRQTSIPCQICKEMVLKLCSTILDPTVRSKL